MSIVADEYEFVVGVDTHARTHTYVVVDTGTGGVVGCQDFSTDGRGLDRAVDWVGRCCGSGRVLAAVECTSTYGAGITTVLMAGGITVVQAIPPKRTGTRNKGKSDRIDAQAAARSVMGASMDQLCWPKDLADQTTAIRMTLSARDQMNHHMVASRNALNALVRSTPQLGVDARKALTDQQVTQIAGWQVDAEDITVEGTARLQAHRLANQITDVDKELRINVKRLETMVRQVAASLIDEFVGIGPVVAGQILASRGQVGRIRTEAAFAALAGVAPIPASSGNTQRHRLSRGGDRKLNKALDTAVRYRISHDPETQAYVAKRQNGPRPLGTREIRRILRRYLARQIHRHLARQGL